MAKYRGVWARDDKGRIVVTQSMVSGFVGCPREVYYANVLGLRPRISSKPLTRGTWVHSLLEEKAKGNDWRVEHEKRIEEARLEQFDEEVDVLATECERILTSYDWVYRDDPLEPITAELTVERPLFNNKALYRGRIDLIAKDKNGDIWLVDHKTHANFPEWRYRELAFQHYSYLWACQKAPQYKALGIPQPKGFIYDYIKTQAIKTPTLTKSGKLSRALKPGGTTYPVMRQWLIENQLMSVIQGEDMLAIEDDEERAYVEDFLQECEHQDYSHLFRRDQMVFTKEQSHRQLVAFKTSAKRMLQYDWDDPDKIERNLGACSGWTCNYKDLTIADLIHGDSTLDQKTRYVTTSNPLDYYPEQTKAEKAKEKAK